MKNLNLGLALLVVLVAFGGSCKKKGKEEIKPISFNNDVQFLYHIIEKSDDTTKLEVYKESNLLTIKPTFLFIANHKKDSIKITSLLKSKIRFFQYGEESIVNSIGFSEDLNENTIVYVPDDYKEGELLKSINGGNYFEYSQYHNKTVVFFGRSKTFFIPTNKKSDENINNNFKIKIQLPKNIAEKFSPMYPFSVSLQYYSSVFSDQDDYVRCSFEMKIPRPEPTAFFNELYGAARKQRYPYRKSMVTFKPVSFDLPSIINDNGLATRQRIDGIYDIGRAVHHGSLFAFYVSNATDSLYESSLEKSKLMVTEVNKQNIPIGASKEYLFLTDHNRIECLNDQYDLNILLSGDAYKNTWQCNSKGLWYPSISFRALKAELKKTLKRYRIEFIYPREDGKEVRQHMYYQNTGYYYYYIKDELITDENGLTFWFDDITEDLNEPYWEDKIDYNNTGYPRFWQFRGYDIDFPN